jgi:diketogulonate reductase-like aldo/keto reductase
VVSNSISDRVTLNNGVSMPWLGLGVWQGRPKDGPEVEKAILTALESGYRLIDTAAGYENEVGVGRAVRASGLPREDVFVTTKIRNGDQGYASTLKAFAESQRKLDLDYVDLLLIHWPVTGQYKETWRAFEKLYQEGYVKAIGVSNFQIRHLKDLMNEFAILPAVNQIEYHPLLTQMEVHSFCTQHGIQVEAWSPLMQGNLRQPLLSSLARKYGKSAAQVTLRWDLQNEVVTIPKSIQAHRILENANVFDFELTADEMQDLSALNENKRFGPNPDDF